MTGKLQQLVSSEQLNLKEMGCGDGSLCDGLWNESFSF